MTRRHGWITLVGIVLMTVLVYGPARHVGWVYEDLNWSSTLDEITALPLHLTIPGRGLTMASLAWTGDDVATAHGVSLAIHVASGLLVSRLAWILTASVGVASAAALVFLLHPMNSQAVLYLSARGDVLMAALTLLAVWLALGPVTLWRWIVIPLALLAASASKESGVIGAVLLLLTLHLWRRRTPQTRMATGWLLSAMLAVALTAMPLLNNLATFARQGYVADGAGTSLAWLDFARLQTAAVWDLLTLVVRLDGFTIDHDPLAFSASWVLLACLLTLQAVVLTIWTWRRSPMVAWAIGWTLLAVSPRFLVPTEEFLAEQHLYLSMAGVSIGIAALARVVWRAVCADLGFWCAVSDEGAVS